MKAPKKIYLTEDNPLKEWYRTKQVGFDSIEYIRKDAFVENALAYLNEKFYFNNLHYAVENNTFNCMEEMFEDFKKYMEGE